ncbi:MAG: hypothetical protein HY063_11990 [Bacteroidetes bacterium]|nr:hypothetical protein [Bacteroidota bacterium]
MLLFTWMGLWTKAAHLFQWSFRVMEGPNRKMNILFIAIGALIALYWLWRQNQLNRKAEQEETFK